ncbi:unnamed protein product [Nesidiocoris tenuis]|uniref:Uncharacterized protein n=1 Tax=Nesidiocoris tenuis TaxID=355587 RepID=A0A6H5H729_9HEMI|nr:unnamed protein product [Nesidiocoris tenuis]
MSGRYPPSSVQSSLLVSSKSNVSCELFYFPRVHLPQRISHRELASSTRNQIPNASRYIRMRITRSLMRVKGNGMLINSDCSTAVTDFQNNSPTGKRIGVGEVGNLCGNSVRGSRQNILLQNAGALGSHQTVHYLTIYTKLRSVTMEPRRGRPVRMKRPVGICDYIRCYIAIDGFISFARASIAKVRGRDGRKVLTARDHEIAL